MHKREEKRGGGGLSIRSYKGGGKRKIGQKYGGELRPWNEAHSTHVHIIL